MTWFADLGGDAHRARADRRRRVKLHKFPAGRRWCWTSRTAKALNSAGGGRS